MSITIRDIAKKSNVSIATVSRVLNNSAHVSRETRIKVEKAIRELNYTPPTLKRNFPRERTDTIGLLMPDIKNIFYPAVIRGIEEELEKRANEVLIRSMHRRKKYLLSDG